MFTYSIIGILFVITVFLAFYEDFLTDIQKKIILAIYALTMVILASTKSISNTADASTYEIMFYRNRNLLIEISTEPTFIYLSRIVLYFGGTVSFIFFIYAIISIPYKLSLYNKITPYIFTALMIYIPVYFELQDMVQIRSAAAATFIIASIYHLTKNERLQTAFWMICAIMFHYSAVIFIPILLIGNRQMNKTFRFIIAGLVPIFFTIYLMKKDLFSLIPSSIIEGKIDYYQKSSESGDWGEMMKLYKNVYFMVKCTLLYICLYYYDYLVEKNKLTPLFVNILIASILSILSVSTIPVLATRISDLYGITDCLVFTFLIYIIEPTYLARFIIFLIGLYMFVYNLIFSGYFT